MDGPPAETADQGVLPLESWEQPPRRQPGAAAAPVLAVDGFEGPLDWLLDLARTRRIDLTRLSIVALVEAFVEALTAALATTGLQPTLLGRWGRLAGDGRRPHPAALPPARAGRRSRGAGRPG